MKPKPRSALYHLTVPVAMSACSGDNCDDRFWSAKDDGMGGTKATTADEQMEIAETAEARERIVAVACASTD